MDEGLAWCGGGRFQAGRWEWLLPVAVVAAAQSMMRLVPWIIRSLLDFGWMRRVGIEGIIGVFPKLILCLILAKPVTNNTLMR